MVDQLKPPDLKGVEQAVDRLKPPDLKGVEQAPALGQKDHSLLVKIVGGGLAVLLVTTCILVGVCAWDLVHTDPPSMDMVTNLVGKDASSAERTSAYAQLVKAETDRATEIVRSVLVPVLQPLCTLFAGAILGYLFGRKS